MELRDRIIDNGPAIVVLVAIAGVLIYLGSGGSLSAIGDIGGETVCGDQPLELDGQTFDSIGELETFVEDRGFDYAEAEDAWDPVVKDGKVYAQKTGEACEN